jgi:hypothetical protein
MDPRLEHTLALLNHHRIALGGLVAAVALGSMVGSVLKPSGLLEEPMAAQLISSDLQTADQTAPLALEAFPSNTRRPWVAGTDSAKANELPRLSTSYDEPNYRPAANEAAAMPDTTPSVTDHAVDAVAEAPAAEDPAA